MSGGRPVVTMYGETFKHFQSATATTEFVLGEFPWQVRVGDRAETRDFVAPPRMLSEERTAEETTWSLGTYMTGAQVWAAFSLPGKAPHARGVFANQPSDFMPRAGSLAKRWLLFAAIVIVLGAPAARHRVARDGVRRPTPRSSSPARSPIRSPSSRRPSR